MTDQRSLARKDEQFMRSALRLAARGVGYTSPNPMVGAVVVKDGNVIGSYERSKSLDPIVVIARSDGEVVAEGIMPFG